MTNPAGNGPALDFNYSAAGNIATRTIAGTSEIYNYDPNHPYAVDTVTSGGSTLYSASYDADGNMTTRNGYQIQWTPEPTLFRGHVVRKEYGPLQVETAPPSHDASIYDTPWVNKKPAFSRLFCGCIVRSLRP